MKPAKARSCIKGLMALNASGALVPQMKRPAGKHFENSELADKHPTVWWVNGPQLETKFETKSKYMLRTKNAKL